MARIVAVSSDLLLGSKVEAMLQAAGHDVTLSPSLADAPLDDADADRRRPRHRDLEALVAVGIPVLGYYSHVDVETKKTADAAGITQAVPRSRMARELPALVAELLED